jgi:predicted enzyme related to lactoylglutathione lyase
MMSQQGKVWWNELATRDVKGSRAFYGNVFGWQFEETDMGKHGTYTVASHGEGPACGVFPMQGEQFDGVPQHWLVYFAVADADDACATIRVNGGSVIAEPFDIPSVGRIAVAADPSGGVFGIMTPVDGEETG